MEEVGSGRSSLGSSTVSGENTHTGVIMEYRSYTCTSDDCIQSYGFTAIR